MKKRLLIFTVALGVAVSFYSCSNSPGPGNGGGTENTPSGVVASLEQAINNLNDTTYRALMHDSMTFYFDADDVGTEVNGYTIPASWPLATDYAEIKSLFANTYSIDCVIDENAIGQPTAAGETYKSPYVNFTLTWYYQS